MAHKILIKDAAAFNSLIESVSDETREFNMSDTSTCFCGHAYKASRNGINGILEDADEDATTSAIWGLVAPRNWQEDEDGTVYTRERAVKVLESIRDTGEFSW